MSAAPDARLRRVASTAAFDQRQDAERVVLRLPVPVSVNDMHAPRKGGGIRRSDAYTAWIKAAGWRLMEQRPGRIGGRYVLDLGLPRESGMDLDNGLKTLQDFLQIHGVIRNDRDAERIGIWWQDETAEAVVVVAPAAGPIAMPSLTQPSQP